MNSKATRSCLKWLIAVAVLAALALFSRSWLRDNPHLLVQLPAYYLSTESSDMNGGLTDVV